jgi:RNA polymerase II-associated factor 1
MKYIHSIFRKAQHAKNVSWLRRTEYISTEATRFQPMSIEKVEAKVGYSMKKALKEENAYMDHESQLKAIEKTFADAKKPILEHSTKKGVTAVEVLPVIPDFKVCLDLITTYLKLVAKLWSLFFLK